MNFFDLLDKKRSGNKVSTLNFLRNRPKSITEGTQVVEEVLSEDAPPSKKIETWIKANKQRFIDKYGERGEEVLYSTAWNMHKKDKEGK